MYVCNFQVIWRYKLQSVKKKKIFLLRKDIKFTRNDRRELIVTLLYVY